MAKTIDYGTTVVRKGVEETLEAFKGDVLLIVNTASACGKTPQFAGLEALHQAHAGQGLRVLGFPCNQFGGQDPGTNEEILAFCQLNYGVSFPMYDKIKVNGRGAHPLYSVLKRAKRGIAGTTSIKWNFTKFLVGRDGTVLKRFSYRLEPELMEADILAALANGQR